MPDYGHDIQFGFFLDPASSEGNNTRIYVVTPAIRHMRFV